MRGGLRAKKREPPTAPFIRSVSGAVLLCARPCAGCCRYWGEQNKLPPVWSCPALQLAWAQVLGQGTVSGRRQGGRVFGSGSVADLLHDLELDILSLRFFAYKIERLSNVSGKSGAGWHMRCSNAALSNPQPHSDEVTPFSTLSEPFHWCKEDVSTHGCSVSNIFLRWVDLIFKKTSSQARGLHQATVTLSCFQSVYFRIMVGHTDPFLLDSLSCPFFRESLPKFPCDPSLTFIHVAKEGQLNQ